MKIARKKALALSLCLLALAPFARDVLASPLDEQNRKKNAAPHRLSGSVTANWLIHYEGRARPMDETATAFAVDPLRGDFHVTGFRRLPSLGEEWLTIKCDSAGQVLWAVGNDGENEGDDRPTAICLDAAGNVYVGGWRWSGSSRDYLTIKYNADGVRLWQRHYTLAGRKSAERIAAIAVDVHANVYVTGSGGGAGGGSDIITIKYDPDGRELWAARYNGPANRDETAMCLVIDEEGQVCVGGNARNSNGDLDYLVLKYNPAGELLWQARYDGPRHGSDELRFMTTDAEGNVLVCGESEGNGTRGDIATLKFDRAGNFRWLARKDPSKGIGNDLATALATDGNGNVYVAGSTTANYVLVKYDSNGVEQWEEQQSHHKRVAKETEPLLAVREGDGLYLAFSGRKPDTVILLKYEFSGRVAWRTALPMANVLKSHLLAMSLAKNGTIHVLGEAQTTRGAVQNHDYLIVTFTPAGKVLQTILHGDFTPGPSQATAMALDRSGSVYVTGKAFYGETHWHCGTVKIDRGGRILWDDFIEAGQNTLAGPQLLPDDHENLYLATTIKTGSRTTDILLTKYNSAGSREWQRQGGDLALQSSQHIAGLARDRHDNILVSAWGGTLNAIDFMTFCWNPSGESKWLVRHDSGRRHSMDYAAEVTVDEAGNVYLTGRSSIGGMASDILTIKYQASGTTAWRVGYNGAGHADDFAHAIAVDKSGNVYLAGKSVRHRQPDEHLLLKYDQAGNLKWLQRRSAPREFKDESIALTLDQTPGNEALYLATTGNGDSGAPLDYDYLIVKYDTAGVEQWTARYDGPAHSSDDATALTLDAHGNVYVTGNSRGEDGSWDFATVKYDNRGTEQWVARYHGPLASDDLAIGVAVDGDGRVYVAGSTSKNNWSQYTIIQYLQDPTAVQRHRQAALQLDYSLQQNYPNPFNPATIIRYTLAAAGHVELKVFDLLGRELATLVNQLESAGEHQVYWQAENLPAGIYVYRLRAGEFVAQRKLIFLK